MNVLDLFSGTGGWSQAFLDRGHNVLRIDNNPSFAHVPNTEINDVVTRSYGGEHWDVVLASPPCECFSLARISRNWAGSKTEPLVPRNDRARAAAKLVEDALTLIGFIRPSYWWMENPVGAMGRLSCMQSIPKTQITMCSYGKHYQKRTNLWGSWPVTWSPRPSCTGNPRNGVEEYLHTTWVLDKNGERCHELARRGAKTGVQGLKDAATRGMIPYQLSADVCRACEAAGL